MTEENTPEGFDLPSVNLSLNNTEEQKSTPFILGILPSILVIPKISTNDNGAVLGSIDVRIDIPFGDDPKKENVLQSTNLIEYVVEVLKENIEAGSFDSEEDGDA